MNIEKKNGDCEQAVELSVVVVSFNTREILRRCLQRLAEESRALRTQVVVVDNASLDQSAEMVERDFPQFQLVRSDTNLGFAAANNLGFRCARGHFLVLLNPDAFLGEGALEKSLARMRAMPEVGLAGGKLEDKQGCLQPSGRLFPRF
jgi:GT2 family glycosyltransferase